MNYFMEDKKNNFVLFIKLFISIFSIIFILGRIFGFSPNEIKSISWHELITGKYMFFILCFSFFSSLIIVLIGDKKK